MSRLASTTWRIAKIVFWIILALAVLGRLQATGEIDQPWLLVSIGLGWAIYMLGVDIDKLRKRIAELESKH